MNTILEKFLLHSAKEYSHMKLGLDRVQKTLEQFSHPESAYPSILIAGTNGKGSVARILESVLLQAGYRTGLYTSPHLQHFTERIRVGGAEVSEEEILAVLREWQASGILTDQGSLVTSSGERLTWFEQVTVLAFEIFRRKKIDLAILEVGLGGRLDATNVVDPLASAITSISLDHTEVLGNSVFEIAREKAGVMRKGRPIVIGMMEENVRTFLVKASRMQGAQPVVPVRPNGTTQKFSYGGYQDLTLGLSGEHQLNNVAVAMEILRVLQEEGFQVKEKALREGLLKVVNPGRLEWIDAVPPILLDGSHNVEAVEALGTYLGRLQKKLTIIMGMMAEKDCVAVLKLLNLLSPHFIFTEVDSSRSLKISKWQEICQREKIKGDFVADPLQALQVAREQTAKDGVIVVTGSLYLVGAMRLVISSFSS